MTRCVGGIKIIDSSDSCLNEATRFFSSYSLLMHSTQSAVHSVAISHPPPSKGLCFTESNLKIQHFSFSEILCLVWPNHIRINKLGYWRNNYIRRLFLNQNRFLIFYDSFIVLGFRRMLMRCLELSRRTTALHLTDLNSTLNCIHTYIVVIIETIRSSETLEKKPEDHAEVQPWRYSTHLPPWHPHVGYKEMTKRVLNLL